MMSKRVRAKQQTVAGQEQPKGLTELTDTELEQIQGGAALSREVIPRQLPGKRNPPTVILKRGLTKE